MFRVFLKKHEKTASRTVVAQQPETNSSPLLPAGIDPVSVDFIVGQLLSERVQAVQKSVIGTSSIISSTIPANLGSKRALVDVQNSCERCASCEGVSSW